MSKVSYDVAKYLADNGFGTLGTDIFVDYLPTDGPAIGVMATGGTPQNYVPISDEIVDIYVKNTDASAAVDTLTSIEQFIHRMHSTDLTNSYVYSFLVIGGIEAVERDPEYSKIYKITIQSINRATALIS